MSVPPSVRVADRDLTESERAELDTILSEVLGFLEKVPEPVTGSLQSFKGKVKQNSLETCKGKQVYELRKAIKNVKEDYEILESWKPGLERMTSFADRLQLRYSIPTLETIEQDGRELLEFNTYAVDTGTGDVVSKNSIQMDPHTSRTSQHPRRVPLLGWSFLQNREPEVAASELWSWLRNSKEMLSESQNRTDESEPEVSVDFVEKQKLHNTSVSVLEAFQRSLLFSGISCRNPTFEMSIPPRGENVEELLSESDSEKIAQSLSGLIAPLEKIWIESLSEERDRSSRSGNPIQIQGKRCADWPCWRH